MVVCKKTKENFGINNELIEKIINKDDVTISPEDLKKMLTALGFLDIDVTGLEVFSDYGQTTYDKLVRLEPLNPTVNSIKFSANPDTAYDIMSKSLKADRDEDERKKAVEIHTKNVGGYENEEADKKFDMFKIREEDEIE